MYIIYNIHIIYHIYYISYILYSKMKWSAIYTNLPVNVIARLLHPRSGDSQGQETFSAPSADKQPRNYDTVLKPPSLPINPKVKGIEP